MVATTDLLEELKKQRVSQGTKDSIVYSPVHDAVFSIDEVSAWARRLRVMHNETVTTVFVWPKHAKIIKALHVLCNAADDWELCAVLDPWEWRGR